MHRQGGRGLARDLRFPEYMKVLRSQHTAQALLKAGNALTPASWDEFLLSNLI